MCVPTVAKACLLLFCLIPATADSTHVFRQYCFGCHGKSSPMAGLNLVELTSHASVAEKFQQWEKVAAALEQKRMPPEKMPAPSDADRLQAAQWVRTRLRDYAVRNDGDPGRVTVRRLTSAEYAYTIRDLTGLDLKFERDFATDTVGGEGFTNFGDVQFMQDANLERYLTAAKTVADHAVIGAGPIGFYHDPGQSGLELSAIHRIQSIYRSYGFRAASGEGGKPYGLERYSKAFFAAWRYLHRAALGEPAGTLDAAAASEGLTPRFVRHIWSVLQQPSPVYPVSEVISRFRKLPAPQGANRVEAAARTGCDDIQKFLLDWPRFLLGAGGAAEGGQGDERALVLTGDSIQATPLQRFRFAVRGRRQKTTRLYISTVSANPDSKDKAVVRWRNAIVRFRGADRSAAGEQPLEALLDEASRKKLGLGAQPSTAPLEFTTTADSTLFVDVATPETAAGLEFQTEAAIVPGVSGDAVARCTISDREEVARGRPTSALLAQRGPAFDAWKAGVLKFAADLPQISHGEPTPSDRDPIPAPFNPTYNQPERDLYHIKVKYYRTDGFLTGNMLDDATRRRLDHAWNDLLASFGYHDAILYFVAEKFKVDLKGKVIAGLDAAAIAALPAEPRAYIQPLRAEYESVQAALRAAQAGHVEDCVRLASQAWRRPLTVAEKAGLRAFYARTRQAGGLDHPRAVRALLARILVAPAFLFKLEPASVAGARPLSGWEMANRLSYFLWASMPDDDLRRAAAAGELASPQHLERQVKRMLADPKARRLSTEFFGQWLGFYRFDQHRGVDTGRFPEFTDELKSAMYDEAVSFFEHIVRNDRPVREILFADYTFLNKPLARFYGVNREVAGAGFEKVDGAQAFRRGGLLRLGAVLTATSAPLRTSPVKRGDWILRRVIGTPTPTPPADAGSIPADEKFFGGLTLREKLAAHQTNPACAACHSRIDPLGFPLERFDAIGRWRDKYSDGKPIDDATVTHDKAPIDGVHGLIEYLKTQEKQVLRTFYQKMLGYALGRTVMLSDQPLIDRLVDTGGDKGFARAAVEIVTSRQFRYRRESVPAVPAPRLAEVKRTSKEGEAKWGEE